MKACSRNVYAGIVGFTVPPPTSAGGMCKNSRNGRGEKGVGGGRGGL